MKQKTVSPAGSRTAPWLVLAAAAGLLDQAAKDTVERMGDDQFPQEPECLKGRVKLHKITTTAFPSGCSGSIRNWCGRCRSRPSGRPLAFRLAGSEAGPSGGESGAGPGAGRRRQQPLRPPGPRVCGGLFQHPERPPEKGGAESGRLLRPGRGADSAGLPDCRRHPGKPLKPGFS